MYIAHIYINTYTHTHIHNENSAFTLFFRNIYMYPKQCVQHEHKIKRRKGKCGAHQMYLPNKKKENTYRSAVKFCFV